VVTDIRTFETQEQQPSTQPTPPRQPPPPPDPISEAVAVLKSQPNGQPAAHTLAKILRNIILHPDDPKYRKIRLQNPKIQSNVVEVDGALEVLLSSGFDIVFQPISHPPEQQHKEQEAGFNDEQPTLQQQEEGFAMLSVDADLTKLQAAVSLLTRIFSLSSDALGASPTKQPSSKQQQQQQQDKGQQIIERQTKVILPKSLDTDVPAWFFERTGAELKASFLAAVRRRETQSQLLTRATREKLLSNSLSSSSSSNIAMVKVRLPEGLLIQGRFGAREPAAAVFAWVADCLNDPLHTFDLILGTTRKAIDMSTSSVRGADLMPTAMLHLRWTGSSEREMAGQPALREELLKMAS
jgi:UBX domain-containing protein 6